MSKYTKLQFIKTPTGAVVAYNPERRKKRALCRKFGISGKRYRFLEHKAKRMGKALAVQQAATEAAANGANIVVQAPVPKVAA